jgi:hypothetical protein
MTNSDQVKKHKLHKINKNVRYSTKGGDEVMLDIYIISSQEQDE